MGMVYVGTNVHNQNIEEQYNKVMAGVSFKRHRIISIIPAGKSIPTVVALSHWALLYPPNQAATRVAAVGYEVGEAYETAIKDILDNEEMSKWEYILTIEHDNVPEPDALLKLVSRMEEHPEYAAISGLYWTKGPGGIPQCWGDVEDHVINFRPVQPVEGECIEVNGIGMGFALWRLSMFKDPLLREGRDGKPRPLFKTDAGNNGVSTQDLWFWMHARYRGYRCAVDCAVKVGHYDAEMGINW